MLMIATAGARRSGRGGGDAGGAETRARGAPGRRAASNYVGRRTEKRGLPSSTMAPSPDFCAIWLIKLGLL